MVSLDGSTRYIGTDFVKLLITGSSNLATEEYVDTAVGGGAGGGDLSNYYTQAETNILLDTKLNITNPQDVSGTLRLGHIDGMSKIILNAVGSNNKDFYVNGNSQILGNLVVSSLDSTGYIDVNTIQTNTFNALNTNDVFFKSNNDDYAQFEYNNNIFRFIKDVRFTNIKGNFISNFDNNTDLKLQINSHDFITLNVTEHKIEIDRDIEMHSSRLKSNILDTWTDTSLLINRNGEPYISLETDNTLTISRQTTTVSNKANGNDLFIEHLNNTTGLLEGTLAFKNANEIYSMVIGGAAQELALNKYVDGGVRVGNIAGYLTVNGARNGSDTLTVNGTSYFSNNIVCDDKVRTNIIDTNNDSDLVLQRNSNTYITFSQANDKVEMSGFLNISVDGTQMVLTHPSAGNYTSFNLGNHISSYNSDATPNLLHLNYYSGGDVFLGNDVGTPTITVNKWSSNTGKSFEVNGISEFSGGVLIAGGGINTNTVNSDGDNDLVLQRNSNTYMTFSNANDRVEFNRTIFASGAFQLGGSSDAGIYHAVESGLNIMDFRNNNLTNPHFRFIAGANAGTNIILEMNQSNIIVSRTMKVNTPHGIECNLFNSNGDNDVVFFRNGAEYIRFASGLINFRDDLVVDTGHGLNIDEVFTNIFDSRYNNGDVVWQFNNVAYMFYDFSEGTFKYTVNIVSDSNFTCVNLTENSDENLKEQIEYVETDCSDLVKRIPVRKYYMKDDESKKHNIGFIAQEIERVIPPDMENVVMNDKKDVKNVNYGRMCAILF